MKLETNEIALHNQFISYGKNAKEWLRKCALLLPAIDQKKIWKKKGFSSVHEYAGKLAGMSRTSVDDALRILRKIEDKAELRKVVEEQGINAVRPVVGIATAETASFWAEKARQMSKNTLETYVREYKKEGFVPADDAELSKLNFRTSTESEAKIIVMDLDPQVADDLQKLKGQDDWNSLMKEFLELRKNKLESEKPEPVKTESRHIPEKIKQFVLRKTRGQCAYPGCAKACTILHHTQRWALENIHDPDRLVALCKAHERLAHHGLIAHEEESVEQWKILDRPKWWEMKRLVDEVVTMYRRKPASLH